jgi:hypothetical protein
VYLEALHDWVERNRTQLEAAGVEVRLSEPTSSDKPSRSLVLSRGDREGDLTVWSTGECEVIVGNVGSGSPEQVHHEFSSEAELVDVLDAFRARFRDG